MSSNVPVCFMKTETEKRNLTSQLSWLNRETDSLCALTILWLNPETDNLSALTVLWLNHETNSHTASIVLCLNQEKESLSVPAVLWLNQETNSHSASIVLLLNHKTKWHCLYCLMTEPRKGQSLCLCSLMSEPRKGQSLCFCSLMTDPRQGLFIPFLLQWCLCRIKNDNTRIIRSYQHHLYVACARYLPWSLLVFTQLMHSTWKSWNSLMCTLCTHKALAFKRKTNQKTIKQRRSHGKLHSSEKSANGWNWWV